MSNTPNQNQPSQKPAPERADEKAAPQQQQGQADTAGKQQGGSAQSDAPKPPTDSKR